MQLLSENHLNGRHIFGRFGFFKLNPNRISVFYTSLADYQQFHSKLYEQLVLTLNQSRHVTSRHVINRQLTMLTMSASLRLDIMTCVWPYGSDHPRVVSQTGRGQSRLDARLVCCCRWWGWWRCNGRIDGFHSVELGTNCDVETIVWLTTQQQQAYVLYIIRRHRHQNTQTDRQTNGRTGRQTDGQTHRQTDWQTDRNEIKAQLVEYLLSETVVSACDLQQHRQLGPVNGLSTYTQQRR